MRLPGCSRAMTEAVGTIFNVQRFSLHDGPGMRTTVFLKGCPLRCVWCHNPESKAVGRQLAFMAVRCIGCRSCEAVCPQNILISEVLADFADRLV